jgi:ATP-dependent Clp protease adaptor protein ClpS
MTTPAIETVPDVTTRPLILPPYAVILHNDDHNEMAYVVRSLVLCVPEVSAEEAVRIMLEAHESGRALVIVCPLERAELYRDRLESRGLTATIEKA